MMKSGLHSVRCAVQELDAILARGEDRSDLDRMRATPGEELEASVDREEEGAIDWSTVQTGAPGFDRREQ